MNFSNTDLGIFSIYLVALAGFGIYISLRGKQKDSKDYFLASKSLPWWAVGGSLIASNISAEQFIGMSGSGYAMGMAIASYELMAAITLIIVAKYFLPIFIKRGIYTMPQFLEQRFDKNVRTGLAFFWVLLFIFVNISSVLYLGGLALESIMGVPMMYGVIGIALFSATFSIFGGLKAVVWTDVIQVVILIIGGLVASYMVLNAVGGGFVEGFATLIEKAPEKFDMILAKDHDWYSKLPGISVIVGGMWIANLYYWGNNQYIIQRALAAKSLKEAQLGTAFAAFLKILLPLIVVIPGIAAFVLGAELEPADKAYPWVLNNHVTTGFKGLAFAALIAAIGSSLSSMINSTSTIFTLDIYKPLRAKTREVSESHLVRIGKISAALALFVGVLVAPALGGLDQAFQYIQEWTGFISPGVVVVFLAGMFWKRATAKGALWVVIISIPLSAAFKFIFPDMPFMDQMGWSFLILSALMIIISLADKNGKQGEDVDTSLFKTSKLFNITAVVIIAILMFIYWIWW